MSLGLQIFLKFLLYSIIIGTVRLVMSIIQKPVKEVRNAEWGERFINSKGLSIFYFIMAICFSLILAFATGMPSNLKGVGKVISIGLFILIILFLLLLSFLYGQVYVRIGKDEIRWRKMNGKEGTIKYNEITSFSIDGSGIVKIFKEDNCILTFPTYEHSNFVVEVLKNRKVSTKDGSDNGKIIMKVGKGYVILDFVFIVIFVIFFIGSIVYLIHVGIVLTFVCIIGSIINYLDKKQILIIVENNTIIEKRMFKKDKVIKFGEVDYLTKKKGNNTNIICVYSKKGVKIQIPKYYENAGLFDLLVSSKKWKWK